MGDLSKGDWPSLHAAARLGLITLRLPGVVLQELVDHRRRDFGQLQDVERRARELRLRLFGSADGAPGVTHRGPDVARRIEDLCTEYADRLVAWFEEVGSVLPDPTVSHGELVRRVLARRRPFSAGEQGYRDALIWYSTLECAAAGPVILLTANTKDFAEKEAVEGPQLASDLVSDLEQHGLSVGSVTLLTTTSAVLELVIPPWDNPAMQTAWSGYISSSTGIEALNDLLDLRFGHELTSPPREAPRWLWRIGVRSLESVSEVREIRLVEDAEGWVRVHAVIRGAGHVGGLAWTWAGSTETANDLVLWDDWGGPTEYYRSSETRVVDVTVAARYRPLVEMESFDIINVSLIGTAVNEPSTDRMRRVQRSLIALLTMLNGHLDDREFLNDVLRLRTDEYVVLIGNVLVEWESVADEVPGRYSTLTPDNLPTVLEESAGLHALRADLEVATKAIGEIIGEPDGHTEGA